MSRPIKTLSDVPVEYRLAAADCWGGLLSFVPTEVSKALDELPHRTIGLFAGNRGGKSANIAYHYVKRVLGIHPVERKNRVSKIRCMSSTLPENENPDEGDNAQYIELMRLLPPEIIRKKITNRTKNLVVNRPDGSECVFEFRSSKQELQDLGKINVDSVWHDEETPKAHREECRMRLLQSGGDEIFSLTPTNSLTYTYDEVFQQAGLRIRTSTVSDKFRLARAEDVPEGNQDIVTIQFATDDNPVLDRAEIDRIFEGVDPAEIPLRRYGIFKQVTGRIHKAYDPHYCYLDMAKTFPDGVPYDWFHCRGIDYHESRLPWSIGWVAASPNDEWFLWQEFHPAIDGPYAYNTYEICKAIARKSGDYEFPLNLIDPLASKKQANSGTSVVEDMNRHFDEIRRTSRVGRPCFWQGWDTKDTKGRTEVYKRFKNSVTCGRPFNNRVKDKGVQSNLPTLWIMNSCPEFHKSIMNWRYGEYSTTATKMVNDLKTQPQQRFSHDNMVLECLAKDVRLLHAAYHMAHKPTQMQGRHRSITGR